MSKRFFVESPIAPGSLTIEGSEAHHLNSVMRVKQGDQIVLFDGSGSEFKATIVDSDRKQVRVEVTGEQALDRELSTRIEIAAALPKGDRQRFLIEKLTEIGVSEFIPLVAERSVVKPDDKSVKRLERMVIEASKQCERNVLMKIANVRNCLEYFVNADEKSQRLIAMLEVEASPLEVPRDRPLACAIGPEGGFTETEFKAAIDAGWTGINLGKRTLRAETAAIAVASYYTLSQQ